MSNQNLTPRLSHSRTPISLSSRVSQWLLLAISCTECSHFFKQVAKLCEIEGNQLAESSHVYHSELRPEDFPTSTVSLNTVTHPHIPSVNLSPRLAISSCGFVPAKGIAPTPLRTTT